MHLKENSSEMREKKINPHMKAIDIVRKTIHWKYNFIYQKIRTLDRGLKH